MKNLAKKSAFFLFILGVITTVSSCSNHNKKETNTAVTKTTLKYATGFSIDKVGTTTIITVNTPWPNAQKAFKYALVAKNTAAPTGNFDAVIQVPINNVVVTSTTHIPALVSLGVTNTLSGYPGTNDISSPEVRALINTGKVKELGNNQTINTEMLLDLAPNAVIGFSINHQNKTYQTIERAGIPVVYNGDWAEGSPLGKAEWVKFFAPFFGKEKEADSLFNAIEQNYKNAKALALKSPESPTVLSGAMYKDVWYLPGGKSWMAQFIKDANATYLWADDTTTGSLSLNFETVYDKAINADYWIGPGQFTAYSEFLENSESYANFKAFKTKNIYTFSKTKGETGGLLYYELASSRPDIVLKDIIHILHPGSLPNYQPYFFKPLD